MCCLNEVMAYFTIFHHSHRIHSRMLRVNDTVFKDPRGWMVTLQTER